MASVNNSQISTKDNLITSSATGFLGGVGFAMCGYNSKPYIKDGGISDEFVRNVENNLAVKNLGGALPKNALNAFNNLIKQIGKAESSSKMSELNFEYFRKLSPDKSFEGIKEFMKQSLMMEMKITGATRSTQAIDAMLDYLSDIMKAKNVSDLKNVSIEYYKNLMPYFDNFEQMRDLIKQGLEENKKILLGLHPGDSIKDMAESLFDVKKQRFAPDKSGYISNDFFKTVEKTAKNLQWKTAGIWGTVAAGCIGGGMFLIQKFSRPKKSAVQTPAK